MHLKMETMFNRGTADMFFKSLFDLEIKDSVLLQVLLVCVLIFTTGVLEGRPGGMFYLTW